MSTPDTQPDKGTYSFSRRRFLQAALTGVLVGVMRQPEPVQSFSDAPSGSNFAPATEARTVVSQELRTAAEELNSEALISPHSRAARRFLDQRFTPEGQQPQAEAAAVLDEPIPELVEVIETAADLTTEAPERVYNIRYDQQVFQVRARTLQSRDYPYSLHHLFNQGSNPNQYPNKQIAALEFNYGSPETGGMTKATIYCLQEYDQADSAAPVFALNSEFYQPDTANPARLVLREDWTVRQFAQAFNPASLRIISDCADISHANALRQLHGGRPIDNTSVIMTNKFAHGAVAIYHEPNQELGTDAGAIYNPSARTATEQAMLGLAITTTHELTHATDTIHINSQQPVMLYYSLSRDRLNECHASLAHLEHFALLSDTVSANDEYETRLQPVFRPDETNGQYDFAGYVPALFIELMIPYAADIAEALGMPALQPETWTLTDLITLHHQYLELRFRMLKNIGTAKYSELRGTNPLTIHTPEQLDLVAKDVFAPVLYARYLAQDTTANDHELFGHMLNQNASTMLFEARQQWLRDLIKQTTVTTSELSHACFQFMARGLLVSDHSFIQSVIVDQPQLGTTTTLHRQPDSSYKTISSSSPEYHYRRLAPHYSLQLLPGSPSGEEYLVSTTLPDEQFLVTVQIPVFDNNHSVTALQPVTLRYGTPYAVPSGIPVVIAMTDMRPDQIRDDLAQQPIEILSITARRTGTTPGTPEPPPPTVGPPPQPLPIPTETPVPTVPANQSLLPHISK